MAAGAAVAVHRRRRDITSRPDPLEISDERKKAIDKLHELTVQLKKYDQNKSGKLERDEVSKLLTDLDHSTPAGTPPTEEELNFIMAVADDSGDGSLQRKELENAIKSWSLYTSKRAELEKALKQFDTSGSGALERNELQEYLKSLNGGKPVSDEEVDWVMEEADVMKEQGGKERITQTELLIASTLWYGHIEKKKKQKSSTCSLL
eukprot:TRINITY_DN84388_c0_g1_i1.p1 TRINITY_DN84388_c0_g1~~TRINITY_DN84388_c0_g1_i1.p1  ORF type:complete len:206 (-),score=59.87 TRINITY_DN84388_c0_g1_i1:124-741(-)